MEDKKLDLYLDIFQDTINITCAVLLWIHVHWILALPVCLFTLVRIGAYFRLGQKASENVQKTYAEVLMGKNFK